MNIAPMRRVLFAAAVSLAAAPCVMAAQTPVPPAALGPGCRFVSDTAVVPTPEQVADRQQLRLALDSIARANGTAAPAGVLYVDVDSMRQGKVLFIDSNLSPEATQAATARVGEYLTTLESGRAYQALIRIDADYVAPAPGKRSCAPKLTSQQVLVDMVGRMMDHHPQKNSLAQEVTRRAVVRLVVSRTGTVSYAEVVQPTGDPYIDPHVQAIAERMRFDPATLDGVPYDVRFRFTIPFTLR